MSASGRRRVELIERRKHLGFTQESLADALGVSTSSIAQWERGVGTPTVRHRRGLASLLEVDLCRLDRLLDPDATPVEISAHVVSPWLAHLHSLEQGAAEVRSLDLMSVPGILQTRRYSDALMRQHHVLLSEGEIAACTGARLARQLALTRSPEPLRLVAVIDESVLLRQVESPEVMDEQIDHLLEMSELDTVELRILPLVDAAAASVHGSFRLLVKQGDPRPFMVCIENATAVDYGEIPAMVDDHNRLFDHLLGVALSRPSSRERLRRAHRSCR